MDINTRSRSELKSFFVRNAIPTESNFADLIDGMLNQRDDRIVKQPDGPLILEAAGANDTSEKPAIQFYKDFSSDKADWTLSLSPHSDDSEDRVRPGLNLSDRKGHSRLFIQESTGRIGIGTLSPNRHLHILADNQDAQLQLQRSGSPATEIFSGAAQGGLLAYGQRALVLGTGGQERMTITFSGKVGIGTSTPSQQLHVVSLDQNASVRIQQAGQQPTDFFSSTDRAGVTSFGNKALVLGTNARERLRITDEGNIGIGTNAPAERLHIIGSIRGNQSGAIRISTVNGYTDIGPQDAGWSHFFTDRPKYLFDKEIRVTSGRIGSYTEDLSLCTAGARRVTILASNGYMGIGVAQPLAPLQIVGGTDANLSDNGALLIGSVRSSNIVIDQNEIQARSNGKPHTLTLQMAGGDVRVNGRVIEGSDSRLKEQISPIENSLERILALNGVSFRFRWENSGTNVGLIAQEVEKIFPEVVEVDSKGHKGISYTRLIAPLIEAVKEQQVEIISLRQTLDELTSRQDRKPTG